MNLIIRFLNKTIPEPNSGCLLWIGATNNHGYGTIRVGKQVKYAHRISYELNTNQKLDSNIFVCHKCDTTCYVNPDHLFLGTSKDNTQDCINKNRNKTGNHIGSANANSKLNDCDIIKIRQLHIEGFNNKQIAKKFNITHSMASAIHLRKAWKHII